MFTLKDLMVASVNGLVNHNGYYVASAGDNGIEAYSFDGTTVALLETYGAITDLSCVESNGVHVLAGDSGGAGAGSVFAFTYNGGVSFADVFQIPLAGMNRVAQILSIGGGWHIFLALDTGIADSGSIFMAEWDGFTYNLSANVIAGLNDTPRSLAYDADTQTLFVGIVHPMDGEIRAYHFEPGQPLVFLGSTSVFKFATDLAFRDGVLYAADQGLRALRFDGSNFAFIASNTSVYVDSVKCDQYYIYCGLHPNTGGPVGNGIATFALDGSTLTMLDFLDLGYPAHFPVIENYPNIGVAGHGHSCGMDTYFFGITHRHNYAVGFTGVPRSGPVPLSVDFVPTFGPNI
jgi:hypothetical protein